MPRTDAEKGRLVLDAFRSAGTAPGGMLSAPDLVAGFQDRELNPDDIETGSPMLFQSEQRLRSALVERLPGLSRAAGFG